MANPLDTDAGSEMFSSYEAELKLVQADLNQKLDQIAEASGEERKAAIKQAERVLDEANELVRDPLGVASSVRSLLTFRLTSAIARPNAHGEAEHPFCRQIQSQRSLSQLLHGYR